MRSFVAIEIKPEIKEAILAAGRRIQSAGLKATWMKRGGIHLTLKFLGEIELESVPEIARTLQEVAAASSPFRIQVAGLGAFPNPRRPRVIWTGVGEETGALLSLWKGMEKSLSHLGFRKEGRGFHPHITIARVRGAPMDLTSHLGEPFDAGRQEAAELVLFQSELHPSGAVHTPLARIPLGG